jgi:hypothetical protein
MLLAGLWATLAIWFRLLPAPPLRELLSGGLLLLTLTAIVCLGLRRWRVVALYGACFAVVFTWWETLQPSRGPQRAQLSLAERHGFRRKLGDAQL